jgi:hypothetical protein
VAWEAEPWFRRARERARRRRTLVAGAAVLLGLGAVAVAGAGLAGGGPYDGPPACRELPETRTGYYHPVHGTSRDCGLPAEAPAGE